MQPLHGDLWVRRMDALDVVAVHAMSNHLEKLALSKWPTEIYHGVLKSDLYWAWVVVDGRNELKAFCVFKKIGNGIVDAIRMVSVPNNLVIAKKLMFWCLEIFKKEGIRKVIGRCVLEHKAYYESMGVKVVGRRPHLFGVGVDGYEVEYVV